MAKRFKFHPKRVQGKFPRPLKTVIHAEKGYLSISVDFTDGCSVFRCFPTHSPYYSAILTKLDIVKTERLRLYYKVKFIRGFCRPI